MFTVKRGADLNSLPVILYYKKITVNFGRYTTCTEEFNLNSIAFTYS